MTYELLTHTGPLGHGVSLVKLDGTGQVEQGFVLNTFQTAEERHVYVDDLVEMTGYPVKSLN